MRALRPLLLPAVALLAMLATSIPGYAQQPESPTVVIVIRHAEKESQGSDPGLNAAGVARTEALIQALAGADVTALYSSEYARTRQTVMPLAVKLDRMVIGMAIGDHSPSEYGAILAGEILSSHKGKTVVVASHSNIVPEIVKAFGVRPVGTIAETEFDKMFIIVIPPAGEARLIATRYGEGG